MTFQMSQANIFFQTGDGVTLRGWFFTPATPAPNTKLPCLILTHGFSCIKEMGLAQVAEALMTSLPLTCLVYDHRGFGSSDHLASQPRYEINPSEQISDLQDAITHAQTLELVDPSRIALLGYSYSGGHVLYLGAVDRRVKAVISLAPATDGWNNFLRLARPDLIETMNRGFEVDRIARMAGKAALTIPVVAEGVFDQCALPSHESWEFFSQWAEKQIEGSSEGWKNEVTLRSAELLRAYNLPQSHLKHITPTPVLVAIPAKDTNTPPDLAFKAYADILEPKQLCRLPGHHYDVLGKDMQVWLKVAQEFLRREICTE